MNGPQVLRDRDFRRFFFGFVARRPGVGACHPADRGAGAARGAAQLGLLTAAGILPSLFFSLWAGARRIHPVEPPGDTLKSRGVAGGIAWIRGCPAVRTLLLSTATTNLFAFIGNALLVLYASRTLGLSPSAWSSAPGQSAALSAPRPAEGSSDGSGSAAPSCSPRWCSRCPCSSIPPLTAVPSPPPRCSPARISRRRRRALARHQHRRGLRPRNPRSAAVTGGWRLPHRQPRHPTSRSPPRRIPRYPNGATERSAAAGQRYGSALRSSPLYPTSRLQPAHTTMNDLPGPLIRWTCDSAGTSPTSAGTCQTGKRCPLVVGWRCHLSTCHFASATRRKDSQISPRPLPR